ncbi:hypothetical protein niasHT_004564 [Heterodera trifolii]|uniref:Transmembrane protein n=1 Tax=Heterodera trifolii TaxID=157864 RepID=A0ABD2M7B5_9BILA
MIPSSSSSARAPFELPSARSSFDYLSIFRTSSASAAFAASSADHPSLCLPNWGQRVKDRSVCPPSSSLRGLSSVCPPSSALRRLSSVVSSSNSLPLALPNNFSPPIGPSKIVPSSPPSRALFLWMGVVHLLFALLLLGVDALSNVLTESRFAVSSALASVFCAVFAFIVARSPNDRASLLLLFSSCFACLALCSLLFLENGRGLLLIYVTFSEESSDTSVPSQSHCSALFTGQLIAVFLSLWPNDQMPPLFRPCLGPVFLSVLFCASLIGISLSLFLLALSMRPALIQNRFRRPFGGLIGRRRRRRTVTKLPLLAKNTVPTKVNGSE